MMGSPAASCRGCPQSRLHRNVNLFLCNSFRICVLSALVTALIPPCDGQTSYGDVFLGDHQWPIDANDGVFGESDVPIELQSGQQLSLTETSLAETRIGAGPDLHPNEVKRQLTPGRNKEVEEGRVTEILKYGDSGFQAGARVCIEGINPSKGSEGTRVEVRLLSVSIPIGPVFCRFGLEQVIAEHSASAGEETISQVDHADERLSDSMKVFLIFCRVPRLSQRGTVSLHASVDGIQFTPSGPSFQFTEEEVQESNFSALSGMGSNPEFCVFQAAEQRQSAAKVFGSRRLLATSTDIVDPFEGTAASIGGTGLGEVPVGAPAYIQLSLQSGGNKVANLSIAVGSGSGVTVTGPLPSAQELTSLFDVFENGSIVDYSILYTSFSVEEAGAYLVTAAIAAPGGRRHFFTSPSYFTATLPTPVDLTASQSAQYTAGKEGELQLNVLDSSGTFAGVDEEDAVWAFLSGPSPAPALQLPVFISLSTTDSGTYALNFSSAFAGTYQGSIAINRAGQNLYNSSALSVLILAGDPDPAFTTFSDPEPWSAPVGTDVEYEFIARDKFGNPTANAAENFTVVIEKQNTFGSSSQSVPSTISAGASPGKYVVSFNTGATSGQLSVNVSLNGVGIESAPIIMEIVPATSNAARSYALGAGTKGGTVASISSLLVIVRDIYGNQLTTGGDIVQIVIVNATTSASISLLIPLSFGDVPVNITDNNDGTYLVTYILPEVGDYLAYVAINGTLIGNQEPFALTGVLQSGVIARLVIRRLQAVVEAGALSWLEIIPLDANGLVAVSDSSLSTTQLLMFLQFSEDSITLDVGPYSGTSWNATFNATVSGTYQLSCQTCPGSPQLLLEDANVPTVTVIPASTSTVTSSLGSFPSSPAAGLVRIPFVAQDSFGNSQAYRLPAYPADSFAAAAVPLATCIAPGGCMDNNSSSPSSCTISGTVSFAQVTNDSFNAELLLTRAGRYQISGTLNGEIIAGSGKLVVYPGPFDPALTRMIGAGSNIMTAGEERELEIYLFDTYQNPVAPSQLDSCVVTLTPVDSSGLVGDVGNALTVGSCNSSSQCSLPLCPRLSASCYLIATFNATVAGNFSLQVTLNESKIFKVAPQVQVLAGAPVPFMSTFALLSETVVAGNSPMVSLDARDRFNNSVPTVDASMLVYSAVGGSFPNGLALSNLTSRPMEDAAASANATGTVLMSPGTVAVQAYLGGRLVAGGPLNITVISAETSPTLSYAFGQGLLRSVGGVPSLFTVQSVSTQGRFQSAAENASLELIDPILLITPVKTLDTPGQVLQSTPLGGGAFQLSYETVENPNNNVYKLTVRLAVNESKSAAISASPFYVPFFRGAAVAARSTIDTAVDSLSVAAGEILAVGITTRDVAGNVSPYDLLADPISLIFTAQETSNSSINVTTVVQNFYNGSYLAIFQADIPGTYNLFFKISGDFVGAAAGPVVVTVTPSTGSNQNSTFPANVLPDLFGVETVVSTAYLYPPNCLASGPGVSEATLQALVGTTFQITTFDLNGTALVYGGAPWDVLIYPSGRPNASDSVVRPSTITDFGNGSYSVEYAPPRSGSFQVRVRFFGEDILNSPFSVSAVAGNAAAATSLAFGDGLVSATAGVSSAIYVQSVDANGINRTGSSDVFEFRLFGQRGFVLNGLMTSSSADGVYGASYTATTAGPATVQVLYQGELVSSSLVEVLPGAISPTTSAVLGPPIIEVKAGDECSIRAVALDLYGNQVNSTDIPFTGELYEVPSGNVDQGLSAGSLQVKPGGGAVYQINLKPLVTGTYGIMVKANDQVVNKGNVTLLVSSREPYAFTTVMSGLGEGFVATRGESFSFSILIQDIYLNGVAGYGEFLQSGALSVVIGYVSESTGKGIEVQQTFTVSSSSSTSGLYSVVLTPSAAGILQARLTLGSFLVSSNSTARVPSTIVAAGELNGARSTIFGSGIFGGIVMNRLAEVGVCLRDSEGFPLNRSQAAGTVPKLSFSPSQSLSSYNVTKGKGCYYLITYSISSSSTSAFDVTVTVTAGTQPLGLGTYVVSVQPTIGSAETVVALNSFQEEIGSALLGLPVQSGPTVFQMEGRDMHAIASPLALADVLVNVGPFEGTSWGERGGSVTFTSTVRGKINVSVVAPKAGRYTVAYALARDYIGGTFELVIPPGPAVNATLTYSGTLSTHAGTVGSVTVQTFDESGQLRAHETGEEADLLTLDLLREDTAKVVMTSIPRVSSMGAYIGSYQATFAGAYLLRLHLNGTEVASSPLTIRPGAFYGGISSVSVFPTTIQAGSSAMLNLTAADAYGNPYTSPDLTFTLTLTPPIGRSEVAGLLQSGPSSPYTGTLSAFSAGTVAVTVAEAASGIEPLGSPFNLTVLAGPTSARGTSLLAPAGGVAGSVVYFVVVARDAYFNLVNATIGVDIEVTVIELSSGDPLPVQVADPALANSSLVNVPNGGILLACQPSQASSLSISAAVGGVQVGGSPATLTVLPQRAPVIESALFDMTQRGISVTFTSSTDRAGAKHSSRINCSSVLTKTTVSLLGAGPVCFWRSSSVLAVLLGVKPKLTPFTRLLSSEAQNATITVRSVLAAKGNASYTSVSSVAVGPAVRESGKGGVVRSPRTIVAQLWGPPVAGICDAVTMDASGSISGGGIVEQFIYRVVSNQSSPELDLLLSSHNATSPLLAVPPGILVPGITYQFVVYATDAQQLDIGTAAFNVLQSADPLPSVRILVPGGKGGVREVVAARNQPLVLNARVTRPNTTCLSEEEYSGGTSVSLQWSQLAGPDLNLSVSAPLNRSTSTTSFAIPAMALTAGEVYTFAVTATMEADESLFSQDVVTVAVQPSDLYVAIVGGNRTASANSDLLLQASAIDPDESGGDQPFQYIWSCQNGDFSISECFPNQESVLSLNQPSILIPKFSLTSGTYVFKVEVSRNPIAFRGKVVPGRVNQAAFAAIQVLERAVPEISVERSDAQAAKGAIDYSKMLQLSCTTPGRPYTYSWTYASFDGDLNLNVTDRPLAISASTLNVSMLYPFRCDVFESSSGALAASATLSVQGSEAPWGGSVKVQPANGDPTGYLYKISAIDWAAQDEDRPLQYACSCLLENSSQVILLAGPSSFYEQVVYLPPGNVTLFVSVSNSKGQSTTVTYGQTLVVPNASDVLTTAEVSAPSSSTEWVVNVLQPALSLGDVTAALQTADIYLRLYGAQNASELVAVLDGSLLLWGAAAVAPSAADLEQLLCFVGGATDALPLGSITDTELTSILNVLSDVTPLFSGPAASMQLTRRTAECLFSLASRILVAGSQPSVSETARNRTFAAVLLLPGQLAEGLLQGQAEGTPVETFTSAQVDMAAAVVQTSGGADFVAAVGPSSCSLDCTDSSVPVGGDVTAYIYAFKDIIPLPEDLRLQGGATVVGMIYRGNPVAADLTITASISDSINGSVGVRAWTGSSWSNAGIIPQTAENSSVVTAEVTQIAGRGTFAPYLERVLLPELSLPLVPPPPERSDSGPTTLALLLSVLLPPVVMLCLTLIGLEANRRRHPPSPGPSTSSGSYSPDKGI